MKEIDILKNKIVNLIPIINPGLKNEYGIRAAILYRISPSVEVDSSKIVREAYKKMYGEDIPESADTIFNVFIPFKDFCRAKLMKLKYNVQIPDNDLLWLIFNHLNEIFDGYNDLKSLFDRYFDLMYSFSNLVPVPKYFNGSGNKNGKGTWKLNKDYPSIYYDNLNDFKSDIFKREEMKIWIDSVMDKYKIKEMYKLAPPYPIDEYYGFDDEKLIQLMSFLKSAIRLIEDRFNEDEKKDTNIVLSAKSL